MGILSHCVRLSWGPTDTSAVSHVLTLFNFVFNTTVSRLCLALSVWSVFRSPSISIVQLQPSGGAVPDLRVDAPRRCVYFRCLAPVCFLLRFRCQITCTMRTFYSENKTSQLCPRMLFIVSENNVHFILSCNSVAETKQNVRSVTLMLAVSPR